MRRSHRISILLSFLCLAFACHARSTVVTEEGEEQANAASEETQAIDQPKETAVATNQPAMDPSAPSKEPAEEKPPVPQAPVIVTPPGPLARIESLSFAHGNGFCLEAKKDGSTSLETCKENQMGQKFLFVRSLDGRYQLQESGGQRCLAMGSIGFFTTLLRVEVCESKASQFFSVVDYGSNYSLKYDANNTCLDAEDSGLVAGTRIVFYSCSAALNQRIQSSKK